MTSKRIAGIILLAIVLAAVWYCYAQSQKPELPGVVVGGRACLPAEPGQQARESPLTQVPSGEGIVVFKTVSYIKYRIKKV